MKKSTTQGNRFVSYGKFVINDKLACSLYLLNGHAIAAAGEEEIKYKSSGSQ